VKGGSSAADLSDKSLYGEITENGNRWYDLSLYRTSILHGGATEMLEIQKSFAFAGGNAAVGAGTVSERMAFLLKKEHDAAIKVLKTNIALKFNLSADGVHLNLAF